MHIGQAFFFMIMLIMHLFSCAGSYVQPRVETVTPVLGHLDNVPQAFLGSDNKYHLVYELMLSNYAYKNSALKSLIIKNAKNNLNIKVLDNKSLEQQIIIQGSKTNNNTNMKAGQSAVVYMHLLFDTLEAIPEALVHELVLKIGDQGEVLNEYIAPFEPSKRPVVIVGPPLKGEGFIAADSCCDSSRHVRAGVPINGRIKYAQRFAVDYEKLDHNNKLYKGPKENLASYNIYGHEALAAQDGIVISTTDNLAEATPGNFPADTNLHNADGNSVIIKIAPKYYMLYAHLQPKSLKVKAGDRVKKGQVLGLVGNSGNSLAPHLHFQVMDAPSALNANGLPYVIDSYELSAQAFNTADFDKAESSGNPLLLSKSIKKTIHKAFPIDLSILNF